MLDGSRHGFEPWIVHMQLWVWQNSSFCCVVRLYTKENFVLLRRFELICARVSHLAHAFFLATLIDSPEVWSAPHTIRTLWLSCRLCRSFWRLLQNCSLSRGSQRLYENPTHWLITNNIYWYEMTINLRSRRVFFVWHMTLRCLITNFLENYSFHKTNGEYVLC